MNEKFRKFASWTSHAAGSSWTFLAAISAVIIWAASGRLFHFSEAWQMVINTGTTIVTFLMVFLIQNTQNRDSTAIHLKLDELLRGVTGARTGMVDLEKLSDEELEDLQKQFARLHDKHGEDRLQTIEQIENDVEEQVAEETGKAASTNRFVSRE